MKHFSLTFADASFLLKLLLASVASTDVLCTIRTCHSLWKQNVRASIRKRGSIKSQFSKCFEFRLHSHTPTFVGHFSLNDTDSSLNLSRHKSSVWSVHMNALLLGRDRALFSWVRVADNVVVVSLFPSCVRADWLGEYFSLPSFFWP